MSGNVLTLHDNCES